MTPKIPREIIGPAAGVVIILLWIIFKFMLKWQKQSKEKAPQNSPSNLNTVSKKSLCFKQEGRISSNETAIEMIGQQLLISNENNRKDHKSMFTKIETLGTTIIKEIHKASGNT